MPTTAKIWLNLRDRVSRIPTRTRDGRDFIHSRAAERPETMFAIEVDGEAVGGIGFVPHQDVERVSAEIGYWLGEPFWGRGIVTEALVAVTNYAIETHPLTRVFACRSRATPRRAACSRKPATSSKRGCAAARSRTARSSISCNTRSSRLNKSAASW